MKTTAMALTLLAAAALPGCGVRGEILRAAFGPGSTLDLPRIEPPPPPDPQTLSVLTWNIGRGASLDATIEAMASGLPVGEYAIAAAQADVWAQLEEHDAGVRMSAIADAIAASAPDVVALQEAACWLSQYPADTFNSASRTKAQTVEWDLVAILLDALAARGHPYRVAALTETLDIEYPRLRPDGAREDLRLLDREVLLTRAGLTVTATGGAQYDDARLLPNGARAPRGWVEAWLEKGGRTFRVLSTHLDAEDAAVRSDQLEEFLLTARSSGGPTVLLGGFEFEPGSPEYARFAHERFDDAALPALTAADGLTCCFDESLDGTGTLTVRPDMVFHKNHTEVGAALLQVPTATVHAGLLVQLEGGSYFP